MRNGRRCRGLALALAAAALAAPAVAGCSDDESDAEPIDKVPTVAATGRPGDACELLDEAALAPLFPGGVPDPAGTSIGEGFAECEWGREGDGAVVLVSTLPAADYRRDYVDQLDVTSPVTGVGDEAVSFPGFVGMGRGSARGGSVGFAVGDRAVMVAVRSGGDPTEDARRATDLARTLADRL